MAASDKFDDRDKIVIEGFHGEEVFYGGWSGTDQEWCQKYPNISLSTMKMMLKQGRLKELQDLKEQATTVAAENMKRLIDPMQHINLPELLQRYPCHPHPRFVPSKKENGETDEQFHARRLKVANEIRAVRQKYHDDEAFFKKMQMIQDDLNCVNWPYGWAKEWRLDGEGQQIPPGYYVWEYMFPKWPTHLPRWAPSKQDTSIVNRDAVVSAIVNQQKTYMKKSPLFIEGKVSCLREWRESMYHMFIETKKKSVKQENDEEDSLDEPSAKRHRME